MDYSQTTTLQEGIRRLEIKSSDDTSSFQSLRRLEGLDCSSGYEVVFENWWSSNNEEVNPVDISYEETEDGVGKFSVFFSSFLPISFLFKFCSSG